MQATYPGPTPVGPQPRIDDETCAIPARGAGDPSISCFSQATGSVPAPPPHPPIAPQSEPVDFDRLVSGDVRVWVRALRLVDSASNVRGFLRNNAPAFGARAAGLPAKPVVCRWSSDWLAARRGGVKIAPGVTRCPRDHDRRAHAHVQSQDSVSSPGSYAVRLRGAVTRAASARRSTVAPTSG